MTNTTTAPASESSALREPVDPIACPFCQSKYAPGLHGFHEKNASGTDVMVRYAVVCRNCGARGPKKEIGPLAITAWNHRPVEANAANTMAAQEARIAELQAIIAYIDKHAPLADMTCAEPGITLSEAARRAIEDEGGVGDDN